MQSEPKTVGVEDQTVGSDLESVKQVWSAPEIAVLAVNPGTEVGPTSGPTPI